MAVKRLYSFQPRPGIRSPCHDLHRGRGFRNFVGKAPHQQAASRPAGQAILTSRRTLFENLTPNGVGRPKASTDCTDYADEKQQFSLKKSAVICVIGGYVLSGLLIFIRGHMRNRRITLNWPTDFRRAVNNYVRSYNVRLEMIELRLQSKENSQAD